MKRFVVYAAAAIVAIGVTAAYADTMGSAPAAKPVIFTPSTITWMPGQGQIPSTVSVAVLDGDPMKAGPYTLRLKIPDGTKFPVHYHNDTERVTVISGIFKAGIGPVFDETKMMELPAGSYCMLPGGLRHYAMAKGETVVQVSGMGPFAMLMDKMGE
jgi:anti-sigma factor ChrR (cupin superfamily)